MSGKRKAAIALVVVVAIGVTLRWWIHDAPRRDALDALARFHDALRDSGADYLDLLVIPAALRDRSIAEQREFLSKALHNEISPDGLQALRRQGTYGPLREVFPAEAETWSARAGVNADECVAFRLKRNGLRAEAVLVRPAPVNAESPNLQSGYRIVRINNVKQMEDAALPASE